MDLPLIIFSIRNSNGENKKMLNPQEKMESTLSSKNMPEINFATDS
jgi:hypothetical protein